MPDNLAHEAVNHIRSWLGAHIEARVLHAALELHLLSSLLDGPKSCPELAEKQNYELYSTRFIMNILVSLGIVTKNTDECYELVDIFKNVFDEQTMAELVVSTQGWQKLAASLPSTYDALLTSAQVASSHEDLGKAQILECSWRYVWGTGIMQLGKHHLFSLLDKRPCSFSELAAQSQLSEAVLTQLCIVGQHTGLISLHDGLLELTPEARLAFGKGAMKEYCRWMEQRLMMEQEYFFSPLGMLSDCIRKKQPVSFSSSLGNPANGSFRRTFVQINRPLIPLLYHTAKKVVAAMNRVKQPIHALEIGAGLGCWGIALASAHPENHITAVDMPEVLAETQQVVTAAKVHGQYTWVTSDMLHITPVDETYDVIVLNEICHTVPSTLFVAWLEHIVQQLSPDGMLLIADMVLDENAMGPARHLLSAAKLLVTGGGQVRSITNYQQLLRQMGFEHIQLHRLATTDLLVASPRKNVSLVF